MEAELEAEHGVEFDDQTSEEEPLKPPAMSQQDSFRPLLAKLFAQEGSNRASFRNSTLLRLISPVVQEYLATSQNGEASYLPARTPSPLDSPAVPNSDAFKTFEQFDEQVKKLFSLHWLDSIRHWSKLSKSTMLLSPDLLLRFTQPAQLHGFLSQLKGLFAPKAEIEYNERMIKLLAKVRTMPYSRWEELPEMIGDWSDCSLLIMKVLIVSDLELMVTDLLLLRNKMTAVQRRNLVYFDEIERLGKKSRVESLHQQIETYEQHIASNRGLQSKLSKRFFFGYAKLNLIYRKKFSALMSSYCEDMGKVKLQLVLAGWKVSIDHKERSWIAQGNHETATREES